MVLLPWSSTLYTYCVSVRLSVAIILGQLLFLKADLQITHYLVWPTHLPVQEQIGKRVVTGDCATDSQKL